MERSALQRARRMPIRFLHTPEIVLLLAVMVGECHRD